MPAVQMFSNQQSTFSFRAPRHLSRMRQVVLTWAWEGSRKLLG